MRKISIIAVLALAIGASASGFTGGNAPANQGGFLGGHSGANSVKAALDARDDTLVTVRGKILSQVAHEKYKFSDGKDTIIIEIDDEDWGGLSVGPDEIITIHGEVDGNTIRANEIDVKRITK